jgi:hypothetical protein
MTYSDAARRTPLSHSWFSPYPKPHTGPNIKIFFDLAGFACCPSPYTFFPIPHTSYPTPFLQPIPQHLFDYRFISV